MYSRFLYRRTIVADGFFSAEHMRMKSDANDVHLMNGNGYMVETTKYERHLKTAVEKIEVFRFYDCRGYSDTVNQKSTCNQHKNVDDKAMGRKPHLDKTGIGGCACERHGCFIPHAMVDFQKGERYVRQ